MSLHSSILLPSGHSQDDKELATTLHPHSQVPAPAKNLGYRTYWYYLIYHIYIYIIYPRWTARIHCKPLVEDSPLSAMTHVEVEKLRVLRTLTGAFGGKWTCSSLKRGTAPQRFDVSSPVAIGGLPSANIDSTSTMLNASSTREVSKPNARNRWNSRSGTCCPWRSRSLIYFAQQQVTAKS